MATISSNTTAFNNAAAWSATAEQYQQMSKSGVMEPVADAVLSIANTVLPFSEATGIFDDGCGTGLVTETLIKKYGSSLPATARLLAGDFSAGMLGQLEIRKKESSSADPTWARLETQVINAMDLSSIPDSSLSHVVSSLCINGLSDFRKAIQECHRVLKPGGVISISGLSATPWFDVFRDSKSAAGTTLGYEHPTEFKSPENLTKLLESEGFKDIHTTTIEMPMTLPPDPTEFFGKFIRGNNPGILAMFGGLSEEQLNKAAELAVARVRKDYGEGPAKLTGISIIGGGRK